MEKLKTILLTGATGFLGSYLLQALLSKGYKVVILKRSTSDTWRIENLLDQCVSYDVNTQSLELAFKDQHVDVVIHTACHYGREKESTTEIVESNLMFGLRLLDLAKSYGIEAFINTDTFLPPKVNSYSLSKNHFYEWLKFFPGKFKRITLKIDYIYGENDSGNTLLTSIMRDLRDKKNRISMTGGLQERDFIHVSDVVAAYVVILHNISELEDFDQFELGTGTSTSIRSFARLVKELYIQKYGSSSTTLGFGDLTYRAEELTVVTPNIEKINELNWFYQVNLRSGLERVMNKTLPD